MQCHGTSSYPWSSNTCLIAAWAPAMQSLTSSLRTTLFGSLQGKYVLTVPEHNITLLFMEEINSFGSAISVKHRQLQWLWEYKCITHCHKQDNTRMPFQRCPPYPEASAEVHLCWKAGCRRKRLSDGQELSGCTRKGLSSATPLHHTWSATNTQHHQKGREGEAQSLSVPNTWKAQGFSIYRGVRF